MDTMDNRKRRGPYGKKNTDGQIIRLPEDELAVLPESCLEPGLEKKARYIQAEEKEESVSFEDAENEDCSVIADSICQEVLACEATFAHLDQAIPSLLERKETVDVDNDFDEIWQDAQAENKKRCSDVLIDDSCFINEECETEVLGDLSEKLAEKESEFTDSTKEYGNNPIYIGTSVSIGAAVVMICCLMIRFRLPEETLGYILGIVELLLPPGHKFLSSVYKLRQFFTDLVGDMLPKVHHFCSFCYAPAEKSAPICSNGHCLKDLTLPGVLSYFIELSIISQLQSLWKQPNLCKLINSHRFEHFCQTREGDICDVYDGEVYQKLYNSGILNNPNNISFSMNTDGVPLFKSSNVSMWPVYMLINELPIALRKKRSNVLFYGMWIGGKKPLMACFLEPLFRELLTLEKGVDFYTSENKKFKSIGVLLTCICDLPARALVYNSVQYNGYYSCWHCKQPGVRHKLTTGGQSDIFPFNGKEDERTDRGIIEDVKETIRNVEKNEKNVTVNGHKGPFWFMYLNFAPIRDSCIIDYMHGALLGCMKLLLTNWFSSERKEEHFSFFKHRVTVSNYLKSIKPTKFITRVPRSLDELAHWKSSEYRNFLLYWGIPILEKVLTRDYFIHFVLFSKGIYLLSKECITPSDLKLADTCLLSFVEMYKQLYNERGYTLNLHNLIHLADTVKRTGPLFVNNCFVYEDLNGYIIQHIHGTQGVASQIVNVISLLKVTPHLYNIYVTDEMKEVQHVYCDLMDTGLVQKAQTDHLSDAAGMVPMGSVVWRELSDKEFDILHAAYGLEVRRVKCFLRLNAYKKGFYVYGTDYKRLEKRQQSIICYMTAHDQCQFGSVICFLQIESSCGLFNVALLKPMLRHVQVGCMWKVNDTIDMVSILVKDILYVCNTCKVDNTTYICAPPNRYDRD